MKARVGLLLGDPSGIGPEITAKMLAQNNLSENAHVLLIGDGRILRDGARVAGVEVSFEELDAPEEMDAGQERVFLLRQSVGKTSEFTMGESNAASGRYVLETLKCALGLAEQGVVDSFCFAPLNKLAMSLGGSPFKDELHLFTHELNHTGHAGELNTFDRLWTTRVTSHIALSEVSANVTRDKVELAIGMAHETLRSAGFASPRIAVAAMNPHGGEGGLFGREELDVIAPAVEAAREGGLAVSGPFPSDTVFLRAREGDFDAVVTMYHDQGQIAMKLMGFDRGVTVHGGLPFPITTPAHGTAFDIVGKGTANPEALLRAFLLACKMGMAKRGA